MTHAKGKIVITGGSGFLGVNLAQALLERGYDVCLISRNPPQIAGTWTFARWDAQTCEAWVAELNGATAVVNLAGRSVDCIKTPETCDEILRSRVDTTHLIGKALRQIETPPAVWVQMSTAHIYGDSLHTVCTETASFGYGLAPFVGLAWEKAYKEAILPTMRQVVFRTSFVLGRSGGALPRLANLAKLGLGGKSGHGRQGISWIHEDDMDALFLRAIEDSTLHGAYLATAPEPVSNKDFMRQLRQALRMPIGLPATAWMVKIAAPLLLRTDPELALYGRYCVSQRLAKMGFSFKYPTLDIALADIYAR